MDTTELEKTDLEKIGEGVPRTDQNARIDAGTRWADQLALPPHSFGRLEKTGSWLAAVQGVCPPRQIEHPRVVLFAGDHGVAEPDAHGHSVSALDRAATRAEVRRIASGGGPVQSLARTHGAQVRVVDVSVDCPVEDFADLPAELTAGRIRRGTGRIDREPACTRPEAAAAFRLGMAVADAEVDAGADLLLPGLLGVGHSTPAAVLIAALTGSDAASVTGRGSGIDDRSWVLKCAAIRDSLRAARKSLADQVELLAISGGPDFAALTGFMIQAATRKTPVLIDGVGGMACALLAQRIGFRTPEWLLIADRNPDPGFRKALDRLNLEPLLDFEVRVGGGCAGLLALPVLRSTVAVFSETGSYADEGQPEPLVRSRL
ncbi:MAG TPA: nicotinate-nucleotide--dimethylbenzimidazole phosphoribosyltransferase [Actinocrinis sp.]|nr:nicotinate-nucleotide--dimethylbenzimidazole phosphoribosyltransferase [Actinocrinis sp.]